MVGAGNENGPFREEGAGVSRVWRCRDVRSLPFRRQGMSGKKPLSELK